MSELAVDGIVDIVSLDALHVDLLHVLHAYALGIHRLLATKLWQVVLLVSTGGPALDLHVFFLGFSASISKKPVDLRAS